MPRKSAKPRKKLDYPKLTRKFYYPRNNYRTAVKILKYLELHKLPNMRMISNATVNNHHDTKITMEFLKKLGYCEEHRIVKNPDCLCVDCNGSSEYVVRADSIRSACKTLEESHQKMIEDKSKPDFNPDEYFKYKKDHVLGRLVWLDCKECGKRNDSAKDVLFKIGQNRLWSLTKCGKHLFLVLYKDEKLTAFIKENSDVRIFELIYALKQSGETLVVKNLISKLNRTNHHDDDSVFEKILSDWYETNFEKIMSKIHTDSLHKPLAEYQKKHYLDYVGKRVQITRNN